MGTSPLSAQEIDRLATYNSEVARGLVHTEAYADEMTALQRRFVRAQIAEAEAKGWHIIGGGKIVAPEGTLCGGDAE